MGAFQNDRFVPPEAVGHVGAAINARAGIHEDRIVAQREAPWLRDNVIQRAISSREAAAEVVVYRDEGVLEMLREQIHMHPLHLVRIGNMVALGVAFTPDTERADIDPCDMGFAVVPPGGCRQEIIQVPQKDGIVVTRLPIVPAVAFGDHDPFGAVGAHPGGRRIVLLSMPLVAGEPKRNLQAAVNEALGGAVHDGPVELALLRFQVVPGEAEIDDAQAREILQCVAGLLARAVHGERVVVVVEDPAHAGIQQSFAVVGRVHHDVCGGNSD